MAFQRIINAIGKYYGKIIGVGRGLFWQWTSKNYPKTQEMVTSTEIFAEWSIRGKVGVPLKNPTLISLAKTEAQRD